MKTQIAYRKAAALATIALGFVVGALAPATHALAQGTKVMVTIPFDFQNGSKHLKAGTYTVGMDSEHVMHLQSGNVASLTLSRVEINRTPSARGKLVFRQYGKQYFLREVWHADQTEHQVLLTSKAEQRVQKEQSLSNRNGTQVALLEPLL